ncbi:hypothetical protein [Geobacillus jurassicus]|uniref:Uncharacterized protein n=1 Tax=Geobacillus jurassicus TaxID=235932 RepID=A0ABV6GWL3_9BACL|nr:hypothetical protein [Geobacillus jurassicus]
MGQWPFGADADAMAAFARRHSVRRRAVKQSSWTCRLSRRFFDRKVTNIAAVYLDFFHR